MPHKFSFHRRYFESRSDPAFVLRGDHAWAQAALTNTITIASITA
jgi:hypothetical protein